MKMIEKIRKIQDENLSLWIQTRMKVFDRCSDKLGFYCVCGRLATGFHENSCKRFNALVDKETLKELEK